MFEWNMLKACLKFMAPFDGVDNFECEKIWHIKILKNDIYEF